MHAPTPAEESQPAATKAHGAPAVAQQLAATASAAVPAADSPVGPARDAAAADLFSDDRALAAVPAASGGATVSCLLAWTAEWLQGMLGAVTSENVEARHDLVDAQKQLFHSRQRCVRAVTYYRGSACVDGGRAPTPSLVIVAGPMLASVQLDYHTCPACACRAEAAEALTAEAQAAAAIAAQAADAADGELAIAQARLDAIRSQTQAQEMAAEELATTCAAKGEMVAALQDGWSGRAVECATPLAGRAGPASPVARVKQKFSGVRVVI